MANPKATYRITPGQLDDAEVTIVDGRVDRAGNITVEVVGTGIKVELPRNMLTLNLAPEPPDGAVVLDRGGDAWQRLGAQWHCAQFTGNETTWKDLNEDYGPLVVLNTPIEFSDNDIENRASIVRAASEFLAGIRPYMAKTEPPLKDFDKAIAHLHQDLRRLIRSYQEGGA